MNTTESIAARLAELVRKRNRELAFDAALKAGLGVVFTFLTFGIIFWMGWVMGFFVARQLNLQSWQFGVAVSGVFFVVAVWSAWRRVDPLAELRPLPDSELLLRDLAHAAGYVYFSPRHATAGAAVVLLGGPANVFEAFGVWMHCIHADETLLEEAARVLTLCRDEVPVEQIRAPAAARLLRRLALIKGTPRDGIMTIMLTDKGFAVLDGARRKRRAK